MIQATENLHLGDLISRRVPFIVPKYQRPYAWEEEEVTDFTRDLRELYEIRVQGSPEPKTHFLGGVVSVNRIAANTFTGRVYDVVDGQQRLATVMLTITLLVRGLCELAAKAENTGDSETAQTAKSYADTTRESYLEYKEVVKGQTQTQLRLKLSRIDATFFETLIRGGNIPQTRLRESQKRLLEAWKLIDKKLIRPILDVETLSASEKLNHLLALRSCITEDCYIIHIVSDSVREAFRLFAILNDRGKSLSEADLLRVHTLELLEDYPVEQGHVEEYWDEILGLKNTEVDQFLHAYYPSYKGDRAPSRDFGDRFRDQFFNYRRPLSLNQSAELEARIASMWGESRVFIDISNGQWPFEIPTAKLWEKDRLSHLIKILKHTLCLPLLMSAYQCLPESEFARLISLLERFVFRYINVVGAHAGKLGDVYYEHAAGLRQDRSGYSLSRLQQNLMALQQNYAPDALFEEALKQKLIYSPSTSTRNLIRYFLTTAEYYFRWYAQGAAGNPTADLSRRFDLNQIELEHIYPQRPAPPDPVLEALKHDIGNLTFWGPDENKAASNVPFSAKKTLYAQSAVLLNHQLAQLSTWDVDAVANRRALLVDMAKRIFTAEIN